MRDLIPNAITAANVQNSRRPCRSAWMSYRIFPVAAH